MTAGGRRWRAAAAAAVCLLLAGCSGLPTGREMGDMALLRTMGVDTAPAGVGVTGSTGPRAKGLQAEGEAALTLVADQASLSGACLAMQGQTDSYVFFGYVDQLLLGEELAERGIRPVLDYFARDAQLGLGAQLWLVRGATAREAVASGGREGVDSRLETLQHDSEMGAASITRTAGEVYTDLLEQGAAFAPALGLSGEKNDKLTQWGYGILKEGALAGFLAGEAARGLELLAGGPSADMMTIELPENKVSVRVVSARTRSRLIFQGDSLSALELDCKVEVRLSEYRRAPENRELEQLKTAVAARERARVEDALGQLRDWRADCAGLGARAAMACPAQWRELRESWPERFASIPLELRIEVTVQR